MIDKNFAAQLAEDLYDFESKHEEEISKLELENKLAWFIIKLPLYYFLYNQSLGNVNIEKRTSSNKDKQSKQSGKELRILKFAIKFWLNWIKIRKSGKGKPLVISLTVDKRLTGNRYKNILFDELFLNKIVHEKLTSICIVYFYYVNG